MKAFLKTIVLLLSVSLLFAQELNSEEAEKKLFKKFQSFLEKYQKQYDTIPEFLQRYDIFKTNYKQAKDSMKNCTMDNETLEFSMGVTQFSDLTPEEFQSTFLGADATNMTDLNDTIKFYNENATDATEGLNFLAGDKGESQEEQGRNLQSVPANFDWRNQGAVTSVKNQGSCGGCWAFCTAANIEGQLYIRRRQSISLSPQQMIDCDNSNNGCNGGMMGPAMNYIRNTGGIVSWSSYPFQGYRNYCRFNRNSVVARVSGFTSAGSSNEEVIKNYLYRTGPLAITMNARTLQNYKGGVYNAPYNYCPYAPDHGVTLVGYGVTSSGLKYWTIKNSWGPYWGEGGYFRIARGRGLCGVNMYVVSAILA